MANTLTVCLPSLHVVVGQLMIMATCLTGDYLLTLPSITSSMWIRACIDNLTHGLVGLLCWAVVVDLNSDTRTFLQVLLCGCLASLVDLDHFLAARSLHIKHAMNLSRRPPFHATSLIPVVALGLFLLLRLAPGSVRPTHLPWIFTVAVLSHHLRDANRRGLWFPPLGTTPPLPKFIYIVSIVILPWFVKLILMLGKPERYVELTSSENV